MVGCGEMAGINAGIEEDVMETLIARSVEVKGRAYAAYSSFPVGAALLTESGDIFTGKYTRMSHALRLD